MQTTLWGTTALPTGMGSQKAGAGQPLPTVLQGLTTPENAHQSHRSYFSLRQYGERNVDGQRVGWCPLVLQDPVLCKETLKTAPEAVAL